MAKEGLLAVKKSVKKKKKEDSMKGNSNGASSAVTATRAGRKEKEKQDQSEKKSTEKRFAAGSGKSFATKGGGGAQEKGVGVTKGKKIAVFPQEEQRMSRIFCPRRKSTTKGRKKKHSPTSQGKTAKRNRSAAGKGPEEAKKKEKGSAQSRRRVDGLVERKGVREEGGTREKEGPFLPTMRRAVGEARSPQERKKGFRDNGSKKGKFRKEKLRKHREKGNLCPNRGWNRGVSPVWQGVVAEYKASG